MLLLIYDAFQTHFSISLELGYKIALFCTYLVLLILVWGTFIESSDYL